MTGVPEQQTDGRRQVAAPPTPQRTLHTQPPAVKHGGRPSQSVIWRAYHCCHEPWADSLYKVLKDQPAGLVATASTATLFGTTAMIVAFGIGILLDNEEGFSAVQRVDFNAGVLAWVAIRWSRARLWMLGGFLAGVATLLLVRLVLRIAKRSWTGDACGLMFTMGIANLLFLLFCTLASFPFAGAVAVALEDGRWLLGGVIVLPCLVQLGCLTGFIEMIADGVVRESSRESGDVQGLGCVTYCTYALCGPPGPRELEQTLLRLAAPDDANIREALGEGGEIRSRGTSASDLASTLQRGHGHVPLGVVFAIACGGGEAVQELAQLIRAPSLRNRRTAKWLLRSTARETRLELARRAKSLLCPKHLVRCHAHRVRVSWLSSVTYYGCRVCHQSREFLDCPGGIVAVLDEKMESDCEQVDGTLRVNWLRRRELFDFDRVEIHNASDEEIERFAVAVGNDTDPVRRSRYRRMDVTVAAPRQVPDEIQRILRQFFRSVKVESKDEK